MKKIIYVAETELFLQRHSVQDFSLVYSHLVTAIKDLCGDKDKFKLALERYLLHNSFYSLEEYFNT